MPRLAMPTTPRMDEDEDGEKEAKAPRKDADADAATAAAAAPEIEMPPVTIDPNTGKASIEINVKGNEGRVIGKGGETIRHMERKFNCKIEMRRDRGTCLVTGPENVMRDAAEYIAQVIENGDVSKNERAVVTNTGYVGPETPASMIAKIVADARAKIDSGEDAAASDFPDVLKGSDVDEPVAIEVPCPGQEGRVIGRGGATIKEIERQSGAVAKVSKVSLFWLFWQFLAIFGQWYRAIRLTSCFFNREPVDATSTARAVRLP